MKVDFHVHSLASLHAYNTIWECAHEAERKGLKAIAITDHFGPNFLNGSLFQHYASITQLHKIKRKVNNIVIFPGVEIDIVDRDGNLAFGDRYFDFDKEKSVLQKLLEKTALVIVSYHDWKNSGEDMTQMLKKVLNYPEIDILGHCDRIKAPYNMRDVIKVASENKKIIELNCKSLSLGEVSKKGILELVSLCDEYKVTVSIGSDAHFLYEIGEFDNMLKVLESIDFPKSLILNSNWEKIINMPKLSRFLEQVKD